MAPKANKIKDIYLAVVSTDADGKLRVSVNNHNGVTTPSKDVLFAADASVSIVLVLSIGGKLYWKRPAYKGKGGLKLEPLVAPATLAVAPNNTNSLTLSEPVLPGDGADLKISWWRILPRLQHRPTLPELPDLESPYKPELQLCNDPYREFRKYYTNVYAASYDAQGNDVEGIMLNGNPGPVVYREGTALGGKGTFGRIPGSGGLDIIEYQREQLANEAPTWEIAGDTAPGVYRYAASVRYRPPGSEADVVLETRGCPLPAGAKTTKLEDVCNLRARDYSPGGISRKVTRVVRRSSRSDLFLSVLDAFRNVPWIYGSSGSGTEHQTDRLVGFDCADLVVGAARLAGVTKSDYTYADALARGGGGTKPRYKGELLVKKPDDLSATSGIQTLKGEPVQLKFGEDVFEGDMIFCDWDANGKKYDHSTVIAAANGEYLSVDTEVSQAHWDLNKSMALERLGDMGSSGSYRIRICHWPGR